MGRNRSAIVCAATLALITAFPHFARAGDAGRAKRDLMMAKDNADTERWDDLDTNMKKAATDMDGLSPAEAAPLQAQIAEIKAAVTKSVVDDVTRRLDRAAQADPGMRKLDLDRSTMRLNSDEAKSYADPAALEKLRQRVASLSGDAAPPAAQSPAATATPTTPAPASLSGDLATAASKARTAHAMLEGGDPQIADGLVTQAYKALAGVPESADKAAVVADLVSTSKQIDAAQMKAQRDEEVRRVEEQVSRWVGTAENSIESGVVCDSDSIDKADGLLATNDVKTYMEPANIKEYQDRLNATRVKLKEHNKTVSIERSADILKELEEKVAADPFKGVQEQDAYKVFNDLKYLSTRVRAEFARVPKDDPEIKAVLDRVSAADAKIGASAGKWAIEKMQEQFANNWKITSDNFASWESESLSPTAIAQRRIEGLDKTRQAVSGTVYWLNSRDTKEVAEKYKDNAVVKTTMQAAQKTLDDASAKLNEAFNTVLSDMEKQPMPKRESDRAQIGYLAHDAEDWFAGTKYKDATVARAQALDTKWKTEVARLEKEMAETLARLTAEANAAWPKIEASVGADKSFDPSNADQWKGKTIEIKGYYNRTGWDFDAAYDYAVGIKGVPVAGNYDDNVRAAFNEGSSHTKFGIDDHVGWDLIAVVEGPGQIKRRVTTEWKDASTHEVIMKTESYVPEPCVVLKIIGLRAGPVAVGPK